MIYILLIALSLIMAAAAFCGCHKPGKNENICKYGQEDDRQ